MHSHPPAFHQLSAGSSRSASSVSGMEPLLSEVALAHITVVTPPKRDALMQLLSTSGPYSRARLHARLLSAASLARDEASHLRAQAERFCTQTGLPLYPPNAPTPQTPEAFEQAAQEYEALATVVATYRAS